MRAPVVSGPIAMTGRALMDATLAKCHPEFELDRDIFERVYGPLEYKAKFTCFCRSGVLPLLVVAFCQERLRA
jgi:hypothetical protein